MVDKAIWAPWRSGFILGKKEKGCTFCKLLKSGKSSSRNLILYRTDTAFVVLNKFPYNVGHVLVIPNRHVGALEHLRDEELLELMKLNQITLKVMKATIKPDAFNIGMNLGRSAGAGIPGHLHMHIVPRWTGDSNFMPIVGKTRVHSIPMGKIYKIMAAEFLKI